MHAWLQLMASSVCYGCLCIDFPIITVFCLYLCQLFLSLEMDIALQCIRNCTEAIPESFQSTPRKKEKSRNPYLKLLGEASCSLYNIKS